MLTTVALGLRAAATGFQAELGPRPTAYKSTVVRKPESRDFGT